jgi:acetyl esterase/lipase
MIDRFKLAAAALLTLALQGCNSLELALANAPSVFGAYRTQRDIAYGDFPAQRLDVYRPEHATVRGTLVFFHGGGWDWGSKDQYRFVAEAFTSRGYVVVVPGYRLYPATTFPGFIEDGAKAVAWTHAHAAELGGNSIFLMGHSAGAHLAMMLAYDERFLRAVGEPAKQRWIDGVVGLSGPYDFLPLRSPTLLNIFAPPAQHRDSQPVNFVDGNEPPTLLLHGLADDTVWPYNTEHMAAKIRDRGGTVQDKYYADTTHGGMLAALSRYLRSRRTVLDDVDAFLQSAQPAALAGTAR